MLTDKEIAAVIFYVKNQFAAVKGIPAVPIDPDLVTKVRQEVKEREGFYMVEEILKDHPMTIFQSP
jgi:hypothetical protein